MRIVVSGTHASGKSTLVSDLAMALGYAQLPDPFELVDDDVEPAGAESFGQQLAVAAERLVELPAGADVVAERGPSTSSPTSRRWPTSADPRPGRPWWPGSG